MSGRIWTAAARYAGGRLQRPGAVQIHYAPPAAGPKSDTPYHDVSGGNMPANGFHGLYRGLLWLKGKFTLGKMNETVQPESFFQCGEDRLIWKFFGERPGGFFVDVALNALC